MGYRLCRIVADLFQMARKFSITESIEDGRNPVFCNRLLKMKKIEMKEYRRIVEMVPPQMRSDYESNIGGWGSMMTHLEQCEDCQKKIARIKTLKKIIVLCSIFILVAVYIVLRSVIGSINNDSYFPLLLVFMCGAFIIVVVNEAGRSIDKKMRIIAKSEERLARFYDTVMMLFPNGRIDESLLSKPVLEVALVQEARSVLSKERAFDYVCDKRKTAETVSVASNDLLKGRKIFEDMFVACKMFDVTPRSRQSIFDQAKSELEILRMKK